MGTKHFSVSTELCRMASLRNRTGTTPPLKHREAGGQAGGSFQSYDYSTAKTLPINRDRTVRAVRAA